MSNSRVNLSSSHCQIGKVFAIKTLLVHVVIAQSARIVNFSILDHFVAYVAVVSHKFYLFLSSLFHFAKECGKQSLFVTFFSLRVFVDDSFHDMSICAILWWVESSVLIWLSLFLFELLPGFIYLGILFVDNISVESSTSKALHILATKRSIHRSKALTTAVQLLIVAETDLSLNVYKRIFSFYWRIVFYQCLHHAAWTTTTICWSTSSITAASLTLERCSTIEHTLLVFDRDASSSLFLPII